MPDINMYGKASSEEYPFDDKYRFWIGQTEEGEDYVSYDRGMNALSDAIVLWDLVDPKVRKEFENFLRTEIEVDWNERETGGYRVTVEQTKRILEFIDDINEKVKKFVDAEGKVLPKYYDYVVETFGPLTAKSGLREKLGNVYWLKAFMRKAVELNYELAFG